MCVGRDRQSRRLFSSSPWTLLSSSRVGVGSLVFSVLCHRRLNEENFELTWREARIDLIYSSLVRAGAGGVFFWTGGAEWFVTPTAKWGGFFLMYFTKMWRAAHLWFDRNLSSHFLRFFTRRWWVPSDLCRVPLLFLLRSRCLIEWKRGKKRVARSYTYTYFWTRLFETRAPCLSFTRNTFWTINKWTESAFLFPISFLCACVRAAGWVGKNQIFQSIFLEKGSFNGTYRRISYREKWWNEEFFFQRLTWVLYFRDNLWFFHRVIYHPG